MAGKPRLPRDVELVAYRILHEALINIRRHAHPQKVTITLENGGGGVCLSVTDDGRGFDVEQALGTKHVGGLVSMRRRAEIAGGRCDIQSSPRAGTVISARLPLKSFAGLDHAPDAVAQG